MCSARKFGSVVTVDGWLPTWRYQKRGAWMCARRAEVGQNFEPLLVLPPLRAVARQHMSVVTARCMAEHIFLLHSTADWFMEITEAGTEEPRRLEEMHR